MDGTPKNTRQLILDTALDIVEQSGVRALTQPRIAKISGLRQSHLTYYFPRKADLYIALLDASHERAERERTEVQSLPTMLESLFLSAERMRFFLSIVLEVSDDRDLQRVVARHMNGLCNEIGARLGLSADDVRLTALVDELRGLGLRRLIDPSPDAHSTSDLNDMLQRHGFDPSTIG